MDLVTTSLYDFNPIMRDKILVCPKCLKTLPLLRWTLINSKVNIIVDCKTCTNSPMAIEDYFDIMKQQQNTSSHYCTRKDGHHLRLSEKYCIECQKWVCQQCIQSHEAFADLSTHTLLSRELHIQTTCPSHSLRVKYYCNDCKSCVCKKCKQQFHSEHWCREEKYIQEAYGAFTPQSSFPYFDSMMKDYEVQTNTIIHELNGSIFRLEKLKRDLKTAFNCYQKNNHSLRTLALILQHNSELLKHCPTYSMYSNTRDNFLLCSTRPVKLINYESNALLFIQYFNLKCFYEKSNPIQKEMTLKDYRMPINVITKAQNLLVICGDEGQIHLRETKTLRLQRGTTHYLTKRINAMLFYSNPRIIVTGLEDGSITFYQGKDGRVRGHSAPITSLIKLKGTIASGSEDKTIKLWNISSCACVYVFQAKSSVLCLSVLKNNTFASGMSDHSILLWDATQLKQITMMKGHTKAVTHLLEMKTGRLASASEDFSVRLWDTTTFTHIGGFSFTSLVKGLLRLNEETMLCCTNNSFTRVNVDTKKFVSHSRINEQLDIRAIAELGHRRIIIASTNNSQVWSI